MGLIIAVSRWVLPCVTVLIVLKCIISLVFGHPKDKVYAYLTDTSDGTRHELTTLETSVGRKASQDVKLDNPTVSKNHAVISRRLDDWHIFDLGSSWGIVVNGQKIDGTSVIKNGDLICFGGSEFEFSVADDPMTVVGSRMKKGKDRSASDNGDRQNGSAYTGDAGYYTDYYASPSGYAKRTFKSLNTGIVYQLSGNHVSIGRGPTNDIKLFSYDASRHHADLVLYENGWAVVDAGSKNGTRLNGQRITAPNILFDGDVIDFSGERFVYNELNQRGGGYR